MKTWRRAATFGVGTCLVLSTASPVSASESDDLAAAMQIASVRLNTPVTQAVSQIEVAPEVEVSLAKHEGEPLPTLIATSSDSVSVVGVFEREPLDESSVREIEFSFDLPEGATLQEVGDGNIAIIDSSESEVTNSENGMEISQGEIRTIYGMIEKPWAVDANSVELPTHYSIIGNTLVQSIDTSAATFPVVADPKITGNGLAESSGHVHRTL